MTGSSWKIPAVRSGQLPPASRAETAAGLARREERLRTCQTRHGSAEGVPGQGSDRKQAQIDNLNVTKYIPIPLIGFEQLKWRSKCEEKETTLHRGFLEQVSREIIALKRRPATSAAHITEQSGSGSCLNYSIVTADSGPTKGDPQGRYRAAARGGAAQRSTAEHADTDQRADTV